MSDPTLTWTLAASPPPARPSGETLQGAQLIGVGGMGTVYRVPDPALDRDVAMKVLRADRADDAAARARFLAEARRTARLDHPGVVPIHAMGTLDDGRPWFTMKQIRGRTLTQAAPGLSTRAHVEVLQRVCEAVAAAHAQGLVHRDLKPDNVMVGPFGEVLVLDWGIAAQSGDLAAVLAGTPGYIAPELETGAPPSPRSDVFALGCLLWQVAGADTDLLDLAQRCRSATPSERPADAGAVALGIRRWQDGADRRARARALVAQAVAQLEQAAALRETARATQQSAEALDRQLGPGAAPEQKRALWALEDRAQQEAQEAAALGLAVEGSLEAALAQAPQDVEVHAMLAVHHFGRLRSAEADRNTREQALSEGRLRRHLAKVPPAHARVTAARQWLAGQGRLRITGPPGLEVALARYVEHDRVLIPGPPTPLSLPAELRLDHGRHQLTVRGPGGLDCVLPVPVARLGDHCVALPDLGGHRLRPDRERVVPGGWFVAGGDPAAPGALPAMELWVPSFAMQTQPVTNGAYLGFLNDLLARGRADDAHRFAPSGGVSQPSFWGVGATGRFEMRPDPEGDAWPPDWAIAAVDFDCAQAFARWQAERDGLPWRLPTEWEWEKAARGTDRRIHPWGDRFDRDLCSNRRAQGAYPFPAAPEAYPSDTSPYGLRHMAGNFHDWCASPWEPVPSVRHGQRLVPPTAPVTGEMVMIRGGSWNGDPHFTRVAARQALVRRNRSTLVSFRLVRSL